MTEHSDPTDPTDPTDSVATGTADPAGTVTTAADEPIEQRFWINTVSLEHVALGVAGGFVQADHGKSTRLRWLRRRDWLVMYSPREGMRAGAPVQTFTALGVITDDEPYQVRLGPDFEPWRRRVHWQPCAAADVRPLLAHLTFVIDKVQWGYPFRRGLFRIDDADFARIASAMAPERHADGDHVDAGASRDRAG